MKKGETIMKKMTRILALALALACMFSLFSLESFAYHGENFTRTNSWVSSVTCKVVNNGSVTKKSWFKTEIFLPEIEIKNTDRSGSFKYTLKDWRGGVYKTGTLKAGQSVKIALPRPVNCTCKGNCTHPFQLVFNQTSNYKISYAVKISGNVDIWQTGTTSWNA